MQRESASTTRAVLDRDLRVLAEDILHLGEMVEGALEASLSALRERDLNLAQEIIDDDAKVNDLRYKIEAACISLIATQAPAAGDLRAVVAAMNMASDLERMGDHAAGIAKIVQRVNGLEAFELPDNLKKMSDLVQQMLKQAMDAYGEHDTTLAYSIATQDDRMDDHYQELFRELMEMMAGGPTGTAIGVYLMFVGHNLERIADRVTNLAERVIFMASGKMLELNPEPGETGTN
jgi:phosphate transport system protein